MRKRPVATALGAAALLMCGVIAWKLLIPSGPLPDIDIYRQRLSATMASLHLGDTSSPDVFRVYAVNVVHTAPLKQPFVGYGIYLGGGKIITAAHVVGHWPSFTNPRVLIAGQDLPATVLKDGDAQQIDLMLLSVDESRLPFSLRLRRNPLCAMPPAPGTRVVVATPERATRSVTISPLHVAPPLRARFDTLISEVETSGSGVFDADKKCFLGVITNKVEKFDYRTVNGRTALERTGFAGYFVPAATIRSFIPPTVKF